MSKALIAKKTSVIYTTTLNLERHEGN